MTQECRVTFKDMKGLGVRAVPCSRKDILRSRRGSLVWTRPDDLAEWSRWVGSGWVKTAESRLGLLTVSGRIPSLDGRLGTVLASGCRDSTRVTGDTEQGLHNPRNSTRLKYHWLLSMWQTSPVVRGLGVVLSGVQGVCKGGL